jgi:hypothetical protein
MHQGQMKTSKLAARKGILCMDSGVDRSSVPTIFESSRSQTKIGRKSQVSRVVGMRPLAPTCVSSALSPLPASAARFCYVYRSFSMLCVSVSE